MRIQIGSATLFFVLLMATSLAGGAPPQGNARSRGAGPLTVVEFVEGWNASLAKKDAAGFRLLFFRDFFHQNSYGTRSEIGAIYRGFENVAAQARWLFTNRELTRSIGDGWRPIPERSDCLKDRECGADVARRFTEFRSVRYNNAYGREDVLYLGKTRSGWALYEVYFGS